LEVGAIVGAEFGELGGFVDEFVGGEWGGVEGGGHFLFFLMGDVD
jgi:hypothetical protein